MKSRVEARRYEGVGLMRTGYNKRVEGGGGGGGGSGENGYVIVVGWDKKRRCGVHAGEVGGGDDVGEGGDGESRVGKGCVTVILV